MSQISEKEIIDIEEKAYIKGATDEIERAKVLVNFLEDLRKSPMISMSVMMAISNALTQYKQ